MIGYQWNDCPPENRLGREYEKDSQRAEALRDRLYELQEELEEIEETWRQRGYTV